jgi:hypothetical protein
MLPARHFVVKKPLFMYFERAGIRPQAAFVITVAMLGKGVNPSVFL